MSLYVSNNHVWESMRGWLWRGYYNDTILSHSWGRARLQTWSAMTSDRQTMELDFFPQILPALFVTEISVMSESLIPLFVRFSERYGSPRNVSPPNRLTKPKSRISPVQLEYHRYVGLLLRKRHLNHRTCHSHCAEIRQGKDKSHCCLALVLD